MAHAAALWDGLRFAANPLKLKIGNAKNDGEIVHIVEDLVLPPNTDSHHSTNAHGAVLAPYMFSPLKVQMMNVINYREITNTCHGYQLRMISTSALHQDVSSLSKLTTICCDPQPRSCQSHAPCSNMCDTRFGMEAGTLHMQPLCAARRTCAWPWEVRAQPRVVGLSFHIQQGDSCSPQSKKMVGSRVLAAGMAAKFCCDPSHISTGSICGR